MRIKLRSAVVLGTAVVALVALFAGPAWAEAVSADPAAAADTGGGPSLLGRLWRFTGVLHPMIVHFPIALLTLAALVELLRLKYRKEISADVTLFCLIIAACAAVAAAALGWARALTYSESDLLFNHRWLGTGLTVLTVVLAGIAIAARRKPDSGALRWAETGGVFIAAGMVGLVGHLGGELTYGEGFVQNAWAAAINPPKPFKPINPDDIAPIPAVPPTSAVASVPPTQAPPLPVLVIPELPKPQTAKAPDLAVEVPQLGGGVPGTQVPIGSAPTPGPTVVNAQPVDFQTQIWPILQNNCVDCHGPKKAKAKLRLDSEAAAMQWDSDGRKLWVKGKSAESYLLKVIGPEVDDDERMPPLDSNKVVTPQEYELLKRWIEEGASWPTLPEAGPAGA